MCAPLTGETIQLVETGIAVVPPALVRMDVFDGVQQEMFDALVSVAFDKFVSSATFSGVQDLKAREKEVPGPNHFYYIKKLGVGSFGEVHAVRKKDSHKRYAMKLMSKQAQAEMSRRWMVYLRIEADVMAALNHPFLVNLNYCFQTPEMAFMVLDLVVGGDLNSFQQRFRTTPPTEAMLRFMSMQATRRLYHPVLPLLATTPCYHSVLPLLATTPCYHLLAVSRRSFPQNCAPLPSFAVTYRELP